MDDSQADALIATLASHPAWEALVQRGLSREQDYFDRLARRLIHDPAPVDQRSLDENRGRVKEKNWWVDEPSRLAAKLAKKEAT